MELKLSTKFKLVSIMSDNLAQSVALIPQEFQVLHYEFGPQCCVHVGHQRCNQRIGQFLDSKLILIFDQSLIIPSISLTVPSNFLAIERGRI
jgi:hypothetical protein